MAAGGRRTVLVVDERPGVRQLLRDCLSQARYDVLESGDSESALRFCCSHASPIDVLIADTFMARMDGFGLADEARRLRPEMRAVLLGAPGAECPAVPRGLFMLPRPFTLPALLRRIHKALMRRQ